MLPHLSISLSRGKHSFSPAWPKIDGGGPFSGGLGLRPYLEQFFSFFRTLPRSGIPRKIFWTLGDFRNDRRCGLLPVTRNTLLLLLLGGYSVTKSSELLDRVYSYGNIFQMNGFTKLFQSIVTSSIWDEDDKTRLVWVTMLAMADKNGVVESTDRALSRLAKIDLEFVRIALVKFEGPDLESRTPDDEGRRIRRVDGGWVLINYGKYRAKLAVDHKREKNREKMQRYRERKRAVAERNAEYESSKVKYRDEANGAAREEVLNHLATPPDQREIM